MHSGKATSQFLPDLQAEVGVSLRFMMNEHASFSFTFNTREEAQSAAHIIQNWAEKELTKSKWTKQLFPVKSNTISVGKSNFFGFNNTAITWGDYNGKINRLADVLHQVMTGVDFSGEQNYSNLLTGFEIAESFVCDGNSVIYSIIRDCSFCGATIQEEDHYRYDDMYFCNDYCAKCYLIERLMLEDDFDEEDLERKSVDELIALVHNYN